MKIPLVLALLAAATFSQAATYDLTASFPNVTGTNPNGPWSYRTATVGLFGPNSALFDSVTDNGQTTGFYTAAEGPGGTGLFRDHNGNTIEGVPSGQIGIRVGQSLLSGFRFTAPEAGPLVLNGSIGAGNPGAVDIVVAVNGLTVSTTPNVSTAQSYSFVSPVNASVGDTLEVFLRRSTGSGIGAKPVTATVRIGGPVPEPATMATLALGALALLRRRRS